MVENTSSILTIALKQENDTICFYTLSGSNHKADEVPDTNYKWGTSIVIGRGKSRTVIIFPETTGVPMVNYWLAAKEEWTGWKNFSTP